MSIKGFFAVFARELRRIFRTKDLLLLCFAAPLLYGIVLSFVYQAKRVENVSVGVIDRDQTKLSRTLVRYADATASINVTHRYDNPEAAVSDMVRGKITGLLYIPAQFAADVKRGQSAYDLISINSANFVIANPAMQSLMEVSQTVSGGIFANYARKKGSTGEKALSLAQPIILDTRTVFNPQMNYSDFFLPGLLFVVLQQIILISLGFSVAEERENDRGPELLALADDDHLALLLGKAVPYFIVNYLMGLFFLFCVLPYFGIGVPGQTPQVLLFLGLFVAAMTAFGVMLSTFFKSVVMALIVLMFYSMPTFLLSGFSWPLMSMPWTVRFLSFIFPSTYFLNGFRMLLLGNAPFRYLLPQALALLLFTLGCFAITYVLMRHLFKRRLTK